MSTTKILVNATPFEKRIAVAEDGRLIELYIERPKDRGLTGNIYKGTVVRVLPGMQAAFVEAGLDRTAFIHVSDIKDPFEALEEGGKGRGGRGRRNSGDNDREPRIQDLLKEGQDIMVQVSKEPIGTKGARVTGYASLAGRYLVLMPTYNKVACSRRISDEKERRRLKRIVSSVRPEGYGFIIRTVCEGIGKEQIESDMNYLIKTWEGIKERADSMPTPSIIYEELDLTMRIVRDIFSTEFEKLIIDSEEEYKRVSGFIDEFLPQLSDRVERYEGPDQIFDAFGVEIEISDALEKKVWLRSGGHIVMDQMEALTAIDVNTGKYVGKKNSEETVLKTNIEAVKEVVYQLRLRNIGGIIVIDFIDMVKPANRSKVYNALKEALKIDKARTNILKISDLGIVEMTRKRTRESLGQSLCELCPYCDGNGLIKAKETIVMELFRELLRELPKRRRKAIVYVNPELAAHIKSEPEVMDYLQEKFKKKVVLKPVDTFHMEQFEIV